MKVEKIPAGKDYTLWLFIKAHLPPSLKAVKDTDGYGKVYAVLRKDWTSHLPFPFDKISRVATVTNDRVELFHPEYFSDFQGILEQYEKTTGEEIILRYWES